MPYCGQIYSTHLLTTPWQSNFHPPLKELSSYIQITTPFSFIRAVNGSPHPPSLPFDTGKLIGLISEEIVMAIIFPPPIEGTLFLYPDNWTVMRYDGEKWKTADYKDAQAFREANGLVPEE